MSTGIIRSPSDDRDLDIVPETGCLSIIVLGASGDLAKKKTFPALYHLFKQVRLLAAWTRVVSQESTVYDHRQPIYA